MRLVIGGSPCTHWSIAQTKNRETEPSGLGWDLFENYLFSLDRHKADFFLYENNKSMSAAIREEITKRLGVEPICINSALVSAQNRQRLYWTNIPGVQQPEDRGILLRDILESGDAWCEKSYCLAANRGGHCLSHDLAFGKNNYAAEPINVTKDGKAKCLRSSAYKDGIRNMVGNTVDRKTCVAEPIRIGTIESEARNQAEHDSKQYRVYSPYGKSVTLCGQGGGVGAKTGLYAVPCNEKIANVYEIRNGLITIKGKQYPIKLADGFYIIRKLTVRECMRLQTVPAWYEFPVSDTQAYKMLGNGWTVDVIAHILSYCPGITATELDVLSMYDGMACGHLALDKLGAKIERYRATEIDRYAIKTASHNFPDIQQLGDAFQVRDSGWK